MKIAERILAKLKLRPKVIAGTTRSPQVREPYEVRTPDIKPLSVLFAIVPRHQEEFFVDTVFEAGFSLTLITYGHSDPPAEILEYLGADENKKSFVVSLGRSAFAGPALDKFNARFATSQMTRGVACTFPVRGVAGVSAYKFLADESRDLRLKESAGKEESMDSNARMSVSPASGSDYAYDTIFAVVNKGYTDVVMEAARQAGARGGTIFAARGTGNPEMERYYGFSIQPEKEVVIILVDRSISDAVIKAIYDAAGLSTNGQGIIFAVPSGRVAGMTAKALPKAESADEPIDDSEYKD